MSADESMLESDRVDLTGISLETIALLPDSVLAASLRRILTESSDLAEQCSSYEEYI